MFEQPLFAVQIIWIWGTTQCESGCGATDELAVSWWRAVA